MAHAPAAAGADTLGRSRARTPPRRGARVHPRLFGRARPRILVQEGESCSGPRISDDLWLFGSTFAAGFLFVSIFIG